MPEDPLAADRLVDDWLVVVEGLFVPGVLAVLVAVLAVVIARVTVVMRALWLSVSASWCR